MTYYSDNPLKYSTASINRMVKISAKYTVDLFGHRNNNKITAERLVYKIAGEPMNIVELAENIRQKKTYTKIKRDRDYYAS